MSSGLKGKLFGGSKVKRARSFSGREKQKWTPAKDAKEDTATTVSDSEAKTHARRPRRRTTGGSETGQEIEKAKRLHAQGNGNSSEPDNQAAQTLSRQQIIAMVKKRFGLKPGEQNGNKPNGIQDVPPAIPPLPTSSPKQKRYELLLDKPGSYPTMPRREENHVPHTNSTPGVVYLQYGDEIKRAMLPAGLDDLQQVQSMFNQTFPDKIKNNADNRKTIYIKDNSCGVFYELDNVGDLSNKSHLKVLESRPFQNGPVSHPVSSSTAVHTGAHVTSTPLPNHSHVAPADAIHTAPAKMAVAEDILKDPYFADLDIDLSQFSEEEKTVILGVMQKAKVLDQQQIEDKFRKPTEGQLSKWTNLMKGWQFRWFTLDPDSGLLEYYVDKEKKKLGPRGSVYLGGSMIAPSDEDSFTFSVSAANGDIFKLRANDAKERQDWINKLRSVAEFHTSSIAQAAPPLYTTHSFSVSAAQSSGPVKPNTTTASSSGHPNVAAVDEFVSDSPKVTHKTYHVPEKIMEGMSHVRDDLYRIEDQQMVFIDQLELDPTGEESLFPLDNDVLILKATAQSALSTLHHCFSILQGQAADVQSETSAEALQQDENTSDFKTHGDKTGGESRSFGFHRNVGTPKSQRKDGKTSDITTDSSGVTCCEKARAEMKYIDARREEEETDDEAYCTGEEPENQSVEEHKSVILHLVSQLKLGMDLTKVVLPTFILEPRSLLEMYADFFAHPDLFIKIPDGLTAEDRILSVLEFYLTSFHAGRKGSLAKKPYNPILGETFHCSWKVPSLSSGKQASTNSHIDHSSTASDEGKVSFVAEQLSHHPPISGFYAECPSKKLCFNAHIWTKSKFYGMSIGVVNQGVGVITLLEHNEDYVITFPSTYCRSILTFPWVELGGKVNITCAKTGYNASVTFHTKPFYGGKLHRVTGEVKNTSSGKVICKVNGEWNGQIEMTFTSHQEEPKIIDTEALQVYRKHICPQSKQEEFESRRLWHRVTHALKTDDIDSATSAKHELEERQRKEARERKETGVEWKTKLFHRHGDGWMYNHHMKTLLKSSSEEASSTSTQPTEQ